MEQEVYNRIKSKLIDDDEALKFVIDLYNKNIELQKSKAHTEEWYAIRFVELKKWAHQNNHKEVFSILANGIKDPFTPPTYAQQMNILKWELEKAKKQCI